MILLEDLFLADEFVILLVSWRFLKPVRIWRLDSASIGLKRYVISTLGKIKHLTCIGLGEKKKKLYMNLLDILLIATNTVKLG